MDTQTITDTNTAGLCPAPQRLTKKQAGQAQNVKCRDCRRIDKTDTLAAGPAGVGWCTAQSQYRSLQIERRCDDFRFSQK